MGTHGPNQGQSVLQAGGEGCGENSLAVDCRHDKERSCVQPYAPAGDTTLGCMHLNTQSTADAMISWDLFGVRSIH
jgi:hypothetical protein